MNRKILFLSTIILFALFSGCKDNGGEEPDVTVKHSLEVDPNTLGFDSGGASEILSILSNTEWTVSCSDTWFSCTPETGKGSQNVTVSATANNATGVRTGSITVTTEDGAISKTVTVEQGGTAPYIIISPEAGSMIAAGGDITINVTGFAYTVQIPADAGWVSIKSQDEKQTVLAVAPNTTGGLRQAEITFAVTGHSSVTKTFTLTQIAIDNNITISSAEALVEWVDEELTVGVTASDEWTVEIPAGAEEWVKVKSKNATQAVFTIYSNTTGIQRQANIIFQVLGMQKTFTLTQPAKYRGGSGAESDPYKIVSVTDLATLATDIRKANMDANSEYPGKYFQLMNDLDLNVAPYNTGEGWLPIGLPDGGGFRGILDGGGHVIRGLYINRNQTKQGLFGCIIGTVKKLGVEGNVTGGGWQTGGLTGCVWGANSKVEECYFAGKVTSIVGKDSKGEKVGGLIGELDRGTVDRCYSTATITGCSAGGFYVGGLIGSMLSGKVTNSYATGVTSGDRSVGGLVGCMNDSYTQGCNVLNCYATGDVTSSENEVGGLVGRTTTGEVTNCYATGAVSGVDYAGGICGGKEDGSVGSFVIANCVALNPAIKTTGDNAGRIMGNPTAGASFSNNKAWSGILNNDNSATWGVADKNGTDAASTAIKAANFFQGVFNSNQSGWIFETNKLPGLKGMLNLSDAPVNLPPHL